MLILQDITYIHPDREILFSMLRNMICYIEIVLMQYVNNRQNETAHFCKQAQVET